MLQKVLLLTNRTSQTLTEKIITKCSWIVISYYSARLQCRHLRLFIVYWTSSECRNLHWMAGFFWLPPRAHPFSFLQSISLAVFLKTKGSLGIRATPNSVRNYKCRRGLKPMRVILLIYFHSSHALLLFASSPLPKLTDHGHVCKEIEVLKILHFHNFHKNLHLGGLKNTKWTNPILVYSMISKLQNKCNNHLCCLSGLPTNQHVYCHSAWCLLLGWQWERTRSSWDFYKRVVNQWIYWLEGISGKGRVIKSEVKD